MYEQDKRKILVVDDEITVCKSIKQSILREEYAVDTALSGEEALEKDDENRYDLIISDLMMPGMSGMDLLKALKKRREEVMIIMITGYPTIKTAVDSIRLGAFDYIPKPFTPNELRSLVSRAFKKVESEEKPGHRPPETKIPSGLYYMIGHTWLRIEKDKLASVGVVHDFLKTVAEIVHLELPGSNAAVTQGEVCARIDDSEKFTHRIWSPASGRVVSVNKELQIDFTFLKDDPYEKGWLFKIEPTNLEEDKKGLVYSK